MEAGFASPPRPSDLGYQAALDAGMTYAEVGATKLALTYFERAVELRPTALVLNQQARCLRDLGRLEQSEAAYRLALEQGGPAPSTPGLGWSLCFATADAMRRPWISLAQPL
jgi:tetratricopeptide (TPR) repeat protein